MQRKTLGIFLCALSCVPGCFLAYTLLNMGVLGISFGHPRIMIESGFVVLMLFFGIYFIVKDR